MSSIQPALALPDRWGLKAPFAAIHHVALVTSDMKKTVAFYRDVLGAQVAMAHRLPADDGRARFRPSRAWCGPFSSPIPTGSCSR